MISCLSLESTSSGRKQSQDQRDVAVPAAGAINTCAPDGLLGSRLPRCSCIAMVQQSHSNMHTIMAEPRNAIPVVPICGFGRAAAEALSRCLSFER